MMMLPARVQPLLRTLAASTPIVGVAANAMLPAVSNIFKPFAADITCDTCQ